ncbi:TetR family transcriptional regulator [Flavobacterium branchiophilum NBRC 15030 = ATCC 35035]|uniref:TetR family transcriptional regulator n=1 Tax=Flavobacterium branchiophilum TaxID=55197 RepID=A0A543G4X3_9FLAO|nr:TetR family transcriptional regulator [Flavobacterium branchiophilum]OXA71281.1 TetR family transcriptional regulator [Flavobacterium branchiophilum NBRC 15030 = ATCC 35035]TQM41136.1 TetR family transcriptional regulator [Flavobacterium branchiophilum]GEM56550.1 TetR family transcriptional regulator [Flavobacterium branchiophilum NBRC 15030 = ATCC 35035]
MFHEKQILILQIAEKLFADNGFDGTSIRDIAKEAQINIAMISYYFGSKEKLLEGIIIYRTNDIKLEIENLFKENHSPLLKIEKLIALYISRIHRNNCIYKILHFEVSNKKRVMDIAAFQEVKMNNLRILEKIIKEGQELKFFKKNITIALITPTILGTYFHFQMNKPFFESLLHLENEAQYEHYIHHDLTQHIQQTIKSLILYENQ